MGFALKWNVVVIDIFISPNIGSKHNIKTERMTHTHTQLDREEHKLKHAIIKQWHQSSKQRRLLQFAKKRDRLSETNIRRLVKPVILVYTALLDASFQQG